jgi:hypothetical protein
MSKYHKNCPKEDCKNDCKVNLKALEKSKKDKQKTLDDNKIVNKDSENDKNS